MIQEAKDILDNPRLDLNSLTSDLEKVNSRLSELSAIGDFSSDEYISLTKKLNSKSEIKKNVELLAKDLEEYSSTQEMLSDEDMKDLAEMEIERLEKEIQELSDKLITETFVKLPDDSKKAIFEIRPGVGGSEAGLFAEELFRSYIRYINSLGYKVEQYSLDYDSEGGIKEATFMVDEEESFGELRFESGVHRVQRIPVTESGGRIHTSTASVVVLPKTEMKDVNIRDEDLKIDFYRSSGPGGQSVNTTDSAVRITHIPSGIVVSCQNGKSQHKNKEMAMSVLASKLEEMEKSKKQKEERELRNASILGGDRSAKIRTYNFQQSRVTDHRVNKSWFNIEEIMQGNLEEIVPIVARELRSQLV